MPGKSGCIHSHCRSFNINRTGNIPRCRKTSLNHVFCRAGLLDVLALYSLGARSAFTYPRFHVGVIITSLIVTCGGRQAM